MAKMGGGLVFDTRSPQEKEGRNSNGVKLIWTGPLTCGKPMMGSSLVRSFPSTKLPYVISHIPHFVKGYLDVEVVEKGEKLPEENENRKF